MAVMSFGADTDFGYVFTVTLTLGQGHDTPWVINNNNEKHHPDQMRQLAWTSIFAMCAL